MLLAVGAGGHACERGEERGLTGPGEAYKSYFERHLP
jgi:hypothetical protein